MEEVVSLFRQVDELTQHDPDVTGIEEDSEQALGHIIKVNSDIGKAVKSTRSRKRKKWWCVLVVVLIIIVIVVVAVVVTVVTQKTKPA
jgi:syntaxin 1B/2/3